MCQDFSGLCTQSHVVLWKRGVSSHDQLYSMFKDEYPELKSDHRYVKFEVTPDKGYLYPEKPWTFQVDEKETPYWFSGEHKKECLREHRKWKKEVYALINLEEVRNPINPLEIKAHKPTQKDIDLLKEWDSVRGSVGASVWDSVGASVWVYAGSLFDIWGDHYQFQPAVDLWKRGFVASFDGTTWRLHSGKAAKIVYEWKKG